MAQIPLAEIPGVPALPGPVTAEYPSKQIKLDGSQLKQNTITGTEFLEPGKAMGKLGYATAGLADVTNELSSRINDAQNAMDITKAQNVMEDWIEQKRTELASKPESEWDSSFSKDLPKLQGMLDGINPSPMAAQRIAIDYTHLIGRARTNIKTDAIHSTIAKGRDEVFTSFGRAVSEGRFEDAEGHLDRGVQGHLITESEKEARLTEAHAQQRDGWVSQAIANDPFTAEADLKEAQKNGKSQTFPWLTSPREIENAARQARGAVISARHDLSNAIDTGIIQEKITSPDQIRKMGEGKLTEAEIQEHLKGLQEFRITTPAGRAELEDLRSKAHAAVETFDPSKDFEDQDYYKRKDFIRALPVGERAEFLEPLKERRNTFLEGRTPKPTSPAMSDAIKQLDWSLENNVLGLWKIRKKGLDSIDEGERLKAAQRKAAIQTDMISWAKENPADAQMPDKVFGRLNSLLKEDRELHRSQKGNGSTWWAPWTWRGAGSGTPPQPPAKLPPPAEMLKQLGSDSASAETIVAPSTFYSLGKSVGGSDETQDGWTNRGFSSMGKNLTPGVVAVNESKYPLGTIFKDAATGEAFIAADRHGNEDESVIDFYVPPNSYHRKKESRRLQVVGEVSDIPDTAGGIRELLSKYGKVPSGESAQESLKSSSVAKN